MANSTGMIQVGVSTRTELVDIPANTHPGHVTVQGSGFAGIVAGCHETSSSPFVEDTPVYEFGVEYVWTSVIDPVQEVHITPPDADRYAVVVLFL